MLYYAGNRFENTYRFLGDHSAEAYSRCQKIKLLTFYTLDYVESKRNSNFSFLVYNFSEAQNFVMQPFYHSDSLYNYLRDPLEKLMRGKERVCIFLPKNIVNPIFYKTPW